jgi:hypothetical protein
MRDRWIWTTSDTFRQTDRGRYSIKRLMFDHIWVYELSWQPKTQRGRNNPFSEPPKVMPPIEELFSGSSDDCKDFAAQHELMLKLIHG